MVDKAYFAQGDTAPPLEVTPVDGSDNPISLTAAVSVVFLMKKPDGALKVDNVAADIDVAETKLRYSWQANDTDEDGVFDGKFVVTWSDGTKTSFPNKGYIPIEITEELT